MGRFLVEAGFEVIAPSRPGYLGTPLDRRRTIDDQADLHAALLDAIGCERAGVVTWSGGGPSGYRLAVRHPSRVSALVAFAAVSQAYPEPKGKPEERLVMQTTAGNRLLRFLVDHAPRRTVSATVRAEGDLSRDEHSEYAAETIPGAERLIMDRGTDLCLFVHPEAHIAQAERRRRWARGRPLSPGNRSDD
jgi:pimeloyl-ACP methyl ester carboxylesterase